MSRNRSLRIAQIAPASGPVYPGRGESVEALVEFLCEGMQARGHDVTLYATADSETTVRLRAVFPQGYDHEEELWEWHRVESFNAAYAFEHAEEHDVIHAHNAHFSLPFAGLTRTPLVETPHTEIPPEVLGALRRHPEVHVVAVSDYQRRQLEPRENLSTIPHGISFDAFPFGEGPGEYLMFLGRLLADKGPAQAIQIAQAADMPLILAGPAEEDYDILAEPGIDGERIRWVGRVSPEERNRLLAGAAALLFPLVYPEPFGLVLLEAMACGTPVLATRVGAAPEIVEEGVTGFTAGTWQRLAELVPAAMALDRRRVRAAAARRFDVERMIDLHEELYRRLAGAGR